MIIFSFERFEGACQTASISSFSSADECVMAFISVPLQDTVLTNEFPVDHVPRNRSLFEFFAVSKIPLKESSLDNARTVTIRRSNQQTDEFHLFFSRSNHTSNGVLRIIFRFICFNDILHLTLLWTNIMLRHHWYACTTGCSIRKTVCKLNRNWEEENPSNHLKKYREDLIRKFHQWCIRFVERMIHQFCFVFLLPSRID